MRAEDRPSGPWPALLLLGPTGAGKTPLGEELERRGLGGRSCLHFDFGANLRSLAAGTDPKGLLEASDLARVRASLATGELFEVRDMPMIVRILRSFAEARELGPGTLLVLNGLPRHVGQARGLAGIVSVERIVLLEAEAPIILERVRSDTGGDRSGRTDDSLEAVWKRLADYRERARPLLDHYEAQGVPVLKIRVTADMSAAEMHGILSGER